MPKYDYRCKAGHEFEDWNKIADREHATCECGESADMVILTAPRVDERKMGLSPDFPSAYRRMGQALENRARGRDMTSANKTVDESTDRKAYEQRKRRGESKIVTSG